MDSKSAPASISDRHRAAQAAAAEAVADKGQNQWQTKRRHPVVLPFLFRNDHQIKAQCDGLNRFLPDGRNTMKTNEDENTLRDVVRYHEETKHHYHRYARSAGHMDWKNQPHPFRFYESTQHVALPLLKQDPHAAFSDLFERQNNSPQEYTIEAIAGFLELSMGLSAWKAVGGSRWALRMNPSSGNLHPTEAHLLLPKINTIPGGVYHYNSFSHALECRAIVSDAVWQIIFSHFGCRGFLIGLSSIFWRESWKYGERAFRYCNHDIGHALAAVSFSANLFGWKAIYLNGLSAQALETVLGFDKTRFPDLEEEHPDLLCFVYPNHHPDIPRTLPDDIISAFSDIPFGGRPNKLSKQVVEWDIIYKTADLTCKPKTSEERHSFAERDWIGSATVEHSATEVIRRRRSATSFDPGGSINRNQFLAMLDKTLPRRKCAPFDVELTAPVTHLFLFVHQVDGLIPGLYFFLRSQEAAEHIKANTKSTFLWKPVEKKFPLFLLEAGNFRQQAMMVSCHQEIAGFSSFSLGMISLFREVVAAKPFCYRHLFWETGMIGQVLYLAAEAYGVRGTGIGCFFDDAVHEVLGLKDNQYQSLYHFTIGKPVDDPRLTTYPPYYHLSR
jgi:SagB-type dehydrogenase family enzyme